MNFIVVQHCFGKPASGGPVMALERLIEHSPVQFGELRQIEGAGGISFSLIYRFVKELRLMRPALLHVRGLGNEGFHAVLAGRLAGVPHILVSVHGTHRDLQFSTNKLRHWVVTRLLEPLTLVMATHIATVCEYALMRPFISKHHKKFVAVVPNGVDLPVLDTYSKKIREEFNITDNLPLAVTVSRITKEKGYFALAEALQLLDAKEIKFALLIVGGGDEQGIIKDRFSELRNIVVHFVGHRSDVSSFLAEADFFIFPSLHENLSNALLEAMSYGLAVIATEAGGNTEVVRRGGGLLVPPSEPVPLANAIQTMLHDAKDREHMGKVARQVVDKHYSVDHMVKKWLAAYQHILGRSLSDN